MNFLEAGFIFSIFHQAKSSFGIVGGSPDVAVILVCNEHPRNNSSYNPCKRLYNFPSGHGRSPKRYAFVSKFTFWIFVFG